MCDPTVRSQYMRSIKIENTFNLCAPFSSRNPGAMHGMPRGRPRLCWDGSTRRVVVVVAALVLVVGRAAGECQRASVVGTTVVPADWVCSNRISDGLQGLVTNCTQCGSGCNGPDNIVDGVTTSPYPLDGQATLDAGLMWSTSGTGGTREITVSFPNGTDGNPPIVTGIILYGTGNAVYDSGYITVYGNIRGTLNFEPVLASQQVQSAGFSRHCCMFCAVLGPVLMCVAGFLPTL